MHLLKRWLCISIFFVFFLSSSGQYIPFIGIPTAEASGKSTKVDLVALLVDVNIYNAIKGDLQRYTTQYIPKHAPGTKTLVIPLNPN